MDESEKVGEESSEPVSNEVLVKRFDGADPMEGFKEVKGGEAVVFSAKGDFVEGILVDVRSGVGKNESMMYDLQAGVRLLSVWGSTVLDGRMKAVNKGDFVRIVFLGVVPANKEHRAYKNFSVGIRPAENSEAKKRVAKK